MVKHLAAQITVKSASKNFKVCFSKKRNLQFFKFTSLQKRQKFYKKDNDHTQKIQSMQLAKITPHKDTIIFNINQNFPQ